MVEIGRLMVDRYLPAEAAAIAQRVQAGVALADAATQVLGLSFEAIGGELAARWNLPESLRATILGTGDPTLVGIARFASAASALLIEGRSAAVQALMDTLDLPGVDRSRLNQWMQQRAAAWSPLQATPQTPVAAEAAPHTTADASKALEALYLEWTQERPAQLEALTTSWLPGLASALGSSHCLLLKANPRGELRVRSAWGKGASEIKSQLRLAAQDTQTVFHAAMQRRMNVSIADLGKVKQDRLPAGLKELLPQAVSLIALPLGASRVTGLLVCVWDTPRSLQADEWQALKRLREPLLPFFPEDRRGA